MFVCFAVLFSHNFFTFAFTSIKEHYTSSVSMKISYGNKNKAFRSFVLPFFIFVKYYTIPG